MESHSVAHILKQSGNWRL